MKQITLSPGELVQLWQEPDGNSVRLYLYYKSEGNVERNAAMHSLRMEEEAYTLAVGRLISLGLLPTGQHIASPEPPSFSREEIASTAETDPGFAALLRFAEQHFGRTLGVAELESLLRIYHWMGFPCEMIMLMISYCEKKRSDSGRRLSMNMVQKTANAWSDKGIDTPDKAEQYLLEAEAADRYIVELSRRLHFENITPTIDKILRQWASRETPPDMVERAWDIACTKFGGKPNFNYTEGILRRWFEKGYRSLAQVEAGEGQPSGLHRRRETDSHRDPSPRELEEAARIRAYYEEMQSSQGKK